ncbi:SO_0444 family Cu/Zn efflux transporter [Candidatus Omnitrophota bacterium]
METLLGIFKEAYLLLNKMSIYLVFGFFFAGVLHIFMKEGLIARHLGKNSFLSVVKASLFGIPLPLCSCGVVPAALALRKDGASKGAVLSFLISTPTTGLDSIFATYALLGWVFTVFRVAASFLTGVFAGVFANILFKEDEHKEPSENKAKCKMCEDGDHSESGHSFFDKTRSVFGYAFGVLLKDVGKWLLIGILIGGVISYFIPEEFIARYLGSGWQSMIIMLLIGIPMYVCSSGSIPIAAALMLKGMNPGAAFVFLLAGPATNSVALTVISNQFGKKTVFVFLTSIIGCSLALGGLLNHIWRFLNIDTLSYIARHGDIIPSWIKIAASSFLLVCILLNMLNLKSLK